MLGREKTKESLRQELTLSEANKQQLEKRLQEEVGICCVREREDEGKPATGADVIQQTTAGEAASGRGGYLLY